MKAFIEFLCFVSLVVLIAFVFNFLFAADASANPASQQVESSSMEEIISRNGCSKAKWEASGYVTQQWEVRNSPFAGTWELHVFTPVTGTLVHTCFSLKRQ